MPSLTTYTVTLTPAARKLARRVGGVAALTREVREELDYEFCLAHLGPEWVMPDLGIISGMHSFTTKAGADLVCWLVRGHAEVDVVEGFEAVEVTPADWTGLTAQRVHFPRVRRKKRRGAQSKTA